MKTTLYIINHGKTWEFCEESGVSCYLTTDKEVVDAVVEYGDWLEWEWGESLAECVCWSSIEIYTGGEWLFKSEKAKVLSKTTILKSAILARLNELDEEEKYYFNVWNEDFNPDWAYEVDFVIEIKAILKGERDEKVLNLLEKHTNLKHGC